MIKNIYIFKEDREKYLKYINMEMLLFKYCKERVILEVVFIIFGIVKGVGISIFFNLYFFLLFVNDDDLRKLFKIYVMMVDIDVLCDDGFFLVNRMKILGLDLDYEYMEGLEYGFVLFFYYKSLLDYIENYFIYFKKNFWVCVFIIFFYWYLRV